MTLHAIQVRSVVADPSPALQALDIASQAALGIFPSQFMMGPLLSRAMTQATARIWKNPFQTNKETFPLAVEIPEVSIHETPLQNRIKSSIKKISEVPLLQKFIDGMDASIIISDFFDNASIAGSLSFLPADIDIEGAPDINIEEGARICFASKSQKSSLKVQPLTLKGFSAWGMDLASITAEDDGRVIIKGDIPFIKKDLTDILLNSPLGPLFARNKLSRIGVEDILKTKFDFSGKSSELTDQFLQAIDKVHLKIQSPPENPNLCLPANRIFNFVGDIKQLLAIAQSSDFTKLPKAISSASLEWDNFILPIQSVGPLKIIKLIANLDLKFRNNELTFGINQLNTTLELPLGFSIKATGNIQVKIRWLAKSFQIDVQTKNLEIVIKDTLHSKTMASAVFNGNLNVVVDDKFQNTLFQNSDMQIDQITLPDLDPGIELENFPLIIKQLKATGHMDIHVNTNQEATINFFILPRMVGSITQSNDSNLDFSLSGQASGSLILDIRKQTITSLESDFSNLSLGFNKNKTDETLKGNLKINYIAADPLTPLEVNWDMNGLIGQDNFFQVDLKQFSGVMNFGFAGKYLIPQLSHSQIAALGDLNIPSQNISINEFDLALKGLNSYQETDNNNPSAAIILSVKQINILGTALSAHLEGLLDLALDDWQPRGHWDGNLSLKSIQEKSSLLVELPIVASFDQHNYSLSAYKAKPFIFGATQILGQFKTSIEGRFPSRDSEAQSNYKLDKFQISTLDPLRFISDGREVFRNLKMNGEYNPHDPRTKITLSGLMIQKIPLHITIRPSKKDWEIAVNGRARFPKTQIGPQHFYDISANGSTRIDVSQMFQNPTLWLHSKLKATTDGVLVGNIESIINANIKYDLQNKSLSLYLAKPDNRASSIHIGPLLIDGSDHTSLDAHMLIKGALHLRSGNLSIHRFGVEQGVVDRISSEGTTRVISDLQIGADSAHGLLGSIIYCGGTQGCYVKSTVNFPAGEEIKAGSPQDYTFKAFTDRFYLSKQSFNHWLKQRFTDMKKWEGVHP